MTDETTAGSTEQKDGQGSAADQAKPEPATDPVKPEVQTNTAAEPAPGIPVSHESELKRLKAEFEALFERVGIDPAKSAWSHLHAAITYVENHLGL